MLGRNMMMRKRKMTMVRAREVAMRRVSVFEDTSYESEGVSESEEDEEVDIDEEEDEADDSDSSEDEEADDDASFATLGGSDVVVALSTEGVDLREGAASSRCRAVDIETCDSLVCLKESRFLRERIHLSPNHQIIRSKKDQCIRNHSEGYFTVYLAYFASGFTIPLDPLLVDIVRGFGLCIGQFTSNFFVPFEGYRRHLQELGLPISFESFQALFRVRNILKHYFYFFP